MRKEIICKKHARRAFACCRGRLNDAGWYPNKKLRHKQIREGLCAPAGGTILEGRIQTDGA